MPLNICCRSGCQAEACKLTQVLGEIDSKQLGQGFRTPGLIRFVSQETGYLSPTSDGPRMFVNLEDYLSHTTGQPNTQFQVWHTQRSLLMLQCVPANGAMYIHICHPVLQVICSTAARCQAQHAAHDASCTVYFADKACCMVQTVISLFHDKCQARLHWGKAGWPEHEPCYDGSVHLPNTWCQFGCAVQVCGIFV